MSDLPLPSPELAFRVGVVDPDDPVKSFDQMGSEIRRMVLDLQGPDWFTEDKRVLDFGCGAGKLLRHFLEEAERTEFIGCDIHEPSIEWLRENFSPPLNLFVCEETPGLPLPDEHVDLALAMSVFTHLTDHWAGWLLEIHRVLKPGGRFVCTFLGEGMSDSIAGEEWQPDRIGLNVLRPWQSWSQGGPSVQHSEWWLRAHWGRAFEFERIDDGPNFGHGLLVLRKRDAELDVAQLLAPEPGEEREVTALRHNVEQLSQETIALAKDRDLIREQLEAVAEDRERITARLHEAEARRSRWRLR